MKLVLLGTGGPKPDPDRMGPAVMVAVGNHRLLFDAGRGVCGQLAQADVLAQDVNPVFITHHHFDHIGSLDDVIMSAWNNGGEGPFEIIGPKGTERIVNSLLGEVYDADIAFRLHETVCENLTLRDVRTLVKVKDVKPGLVYDNDQFRVYADHVDHGHGLGMNRNEWECFGYRIEANGKVIAISGDAVACEGLQRLAQNADILVQSCYLAESEILDEESRVVAQFILASSGQVGKIAARAGVKKLVLTHIRRKSDELLREMKADARKDFPGPVVVGEDLMEIEI